MTQSHGHIAAAQERLWKRIPRLRPASPLPLDPHRLVLGRDTANLPFALDAKALSGHISIVGGIGGGKSNAMRHLGWQHMETPGALIQIDPHGPHSDSLHRTTVRRVIDTGLYRRQRVHVIDANSEWCTGLALLAGSPVPSVMADHMIEAFERLQGDETLLEKPTLRRALHGLLAVLSELKLSLAEADLLLDPMDPHGLREWALSNIRDRYAAKALVRLERLSSDPRLIKEFEIETIGTENRLAPLLSSPSMRAIVGCQMLDMVDVLDSGATLLVNTGGHDKASEAAGDLLGKLVMRAVLFAAKRRCTSAPALVIADECARFVSQDCERALAELRKYRVGLVLGFQTYGMLGVPGDPVRDAIEKIPATRLVFRLNSMQEATVLAPEVVKLNLEMPVEILKAPAVVGYEVRRMRNATSGWSTTHSAEEGITRATAASTTKTEGDTVGTGHTQGISDQVSNTYTRSRSSGDTAGPQYAVASNRTLTNTMGESESDTDAVARSQSRNYGYAEGDAEATSDADTTAHNHASSRGGSSNRQHADARGSSFAQSFNVLVDPYRSGEEAYRRAVRDGEGSGRTVQSAYNESSSDASGISDDWSESESASNAHTHQRSVSTNRQRSWGRGETDQTSHAHQRGRSSARAEALGEQESAGVSVAHSEQTSEAAAHGTAHQLSESWSSHRDHSSSLAVAQQDSLALSQSKGIASGENWAEGWSESLAPIMKILPTSVHDLQKVTHMAAEMLCSLPTGVAVIRTLQNGRVEHAIVRTPERPADAVSDEQYAADLDQIVPHSQAGMHMDAAMRAIDERERNLIEAAREIRLPPPEPVSAAEFRVPVKRATNQRKTERSKR